MPTKLTRRTVLRGLGACISLPLLEAMTPHARAATFHVPRSADFEPWEKSAGAKPRIIYCYVPNGVNIREWVPQQVGKEYELSATLRVLEEFQQDFTVISGLGHPAAKGGHSGADTWLTGADLSSVPGSDYTNSVSIDQVIAGLHGQQTRFSSLQLANDSGTGNARHSYTLSFDQTGTPLPADNSPRRIFERLFVPDSAADRAATLKRYAEKKSILDSVLSDARSLQRRLNQADQQKLDQYFNAVRQTEKRVQRLESWIDVEKPKVDASKLELDSKATERLERSFQLWMSSPASENFWVWMLYLSRVRPATSTLTGKAKPMPPLKH